VALFEPIVILAGNGSEAKKEAIKYSNKNNPGLSD